MLGGMRMQDTAQKRTMRETTRHSEKAMASESAGMPLLGLANVFTPAKRSAPGGKRCRKCFMMGAELPSPKQLRQNTSPTCSSHRLDQRHVWLAGCTGSVRASAQAHDQGLLLAAGVPLVSQSRRELVTAVQPAFPSKMLDMLHASPKADASTALRHAGSDRSEA